MKISEVNVETLSGSNSDNLNIARHWALTNLRKIKRDFDVVYILGSWYGNFAQMMNDFPGITVEKLINVDTDGRVLQKSTELLKDIDNVEHMHKDANTLDYRQLGPDGLVVNFSTTNINGDNWFDKIPDGTLVLLKGRDNDPGAINKFDSLDEFTETYPLRKVLFKGQKELADPETQYNCFLVIGLK